MTKTVITTEKKGIKGSQEFGKGDNLAYNIGIKKKYTLENNDDMVNSTGGQHFKDGGGRLLQRKGNNLKANRQSS